MDRRRQTRVASGIPVRIWGVDAKRQPFQEQVCALNLSRTGALLQKVRRSLRIGEILGLQYNGQNTEYVVVWVGAASTRQAGMIGLSRVTGDLVLWSGFEMRRAATGPAQS